MSAENFAVENFKLALSYLQGHSVQLWQRFNFFLAVQAALFVSFAWFAFYKRSLLATQLVCFLGAFVAVLWYIVSAQDRALMRIYRGRVEQAARKIATLDLLGAGDYNQNYVGAEVKSQWYSIDSWYWDLLSITKLPVWLSLFLILIWLVLLFKVSINL